MKEDGGDEPGLEAPVTPENAFNRQMIPSCPHCSNPYYKGSDYCPVCGALLKGGQLGARGYLSILGNTVIALVFGIMATNTFIKIAPMVAAPRLHSNTEMLVPSICFFVLWSAVAASCLNTIKDLLWPK